MRERREGTGDIHEGRRRRDESSKGLKERCGRNTSRRNGGRLEGKREKERENGTRRNRGHEGRGRGFTGDSEEEKVRKLRCRLRGCHAGPRVLHCVDFRGEGRVPAGPEGCQAVSLKCPRGAASVMEPLWCWWMCL